MPRNRVPAAAPGLPPAQPVFIRPVQVTQFFGIHRATLYRWAASGHITIHRRGAASFVKVADLTSFIETGEVAA